MQNCVVLQKKFVRPKKDITATPPTLAINGGGAGGACNSQSDRSAKSMVYLRRLRIAANLQRFLR